MIVGRWRDECWFWPRGGASPPMPFRTPSPTFLIGNGMPFIWGQIRLAVLVIVECWHLLCVIPNADTCFVLILLLKERKHCFSQFHCYKIGSSIFNCFCFYHDILQIWKHVWLRYERPLTLWWTHLPELKERNSSVRFLCAFLVCYTVLW